MKKKHVLEISCLDDIMDGFEHARNNLYFRMDNCDNIEDEKVLLQSYQTIVNLQYAVMHAVTVIKLIEEKSDEN